MNHNEGQNPRRLTDFEDLGVLQAIWAGQAIPYLKEDRLDQPVGHTGCQ